MSATHAVVLVVVIVALVALWISAAAGILHTSGLTSASRAVWLLVVLALPLAGPVAWFVAGYPKRSHS